MDVTAHISFADRRFQVNDGETVLDCLVRNEIPVPHSCRSGVCQSCLMQATEGDIPAAAQTGLKPTYVKQGLFLGCQCKPAADMAVRLPQDVGVDTAARIVHRDMLNHNVLRLRLEPIQEFSCEPGQYITLINSRGTARSYSIANDAGSEGHIELHVRLLTDGLMSQFLKREADVGTRMNIRGPAGNCFYVADGDSSFPIVLAGTGTGLAPLFGIARQALAKGHRGPVQLFHGALRTEDLYLVQELRDLEQSHPQFRYAPCVLNGEAGRFYLPGHVEDIVMGSMPQDKSALRLYLCGAPDFVKSLRRKAFMAGARSVHIFADAFLPTKPADTAA